MDRTPNLDMPYILPSQAQKHVTHNEAVRMLDCLVQPVVANRTLSEPPAVPAEGQGHIVAAGATGEWADKDSGLAFFQDGAWLHFQPVEGWRVYDAGASESLVYSGSGWEVYEGGGASSQPMFGINTDADATNRLAVKSDAALFSHDDVTPGSGDMQIKLNKAAGGNTASILYQTGYSGRAEYGLTGDDKFHIKVSPDGSAWHEAIVVDSSGNVGIGTDAPEAPFHVLRAGVNIIHERVDDSAFAPTSATRKARGSVGALTQCLSGDVPSAFFGQAYDGSGYVGCGNLRWVLEGDAASGTAPTTIEFWNHTSGVGNGSKLEITSAGTLRPTADNAYTLGDASFRWSAVWAANGTIQTSDERDKHVVGDLTFAGAMVDTVDPVLFRWEIGRSIVVPSQTETVIDDGGKEVPKLEVWPIPGTRQHAGFIAQEIRAAMDIAGVDFGAWGLEDRNDPDSGQWIRPDQLVAVLWAALKETRAEVAELREATTE